MIRRVERINKEYTIKRLDKYPEKKRRNHKETQKWREIV